jgi:hypothetical protein
LPLESAEAIMEFAPEEEAEQMTPKPVLVIGVRGDYLVPESESHQIYERCPGLAERLERHPLFGADRRAGRERCAAACLERFG